MRHFLGLDIGSSFVKAAILDVSRGELTRTERVPFPAFESGLPPLHREVDPRAILSAVDALLHRMAEPECAGLAICGQMHGFVLVDAQGQAVSNYISWLDQRVTAEEFARISALISEAERQELGNEFRSSIAVSELHWLARRKLLAPGIVPVSIADYVAGRLCGAVPKMDPTQAAAFGALRLSTMQWHREVIAKLGLDVLGWPEVRPSGAVVGWWNGAPCYATVGDQQCALAGALLGDGQLSVNIGTGSQIAMLCADAAPAPIQTRPYFGGKLLRTITHIPAGRALSALIGLFTELGSASEAEIWDRIGKSVDAVPETDMRASIAYFPGPCGSTGFLENLHEGNLSAGHVFRAVFDSMARNYESCARRLDPNSEAKEIVFSGGVARRIGAICEGTAAALDLPYRLSPHAEDTLYGLMVLARQFSEARS